MPETIPQSSVTFEQAQAMPKGFSGEFVDNILNDRLELVAGRSEGFLKNYLTNVPPDATDETFKAKPEAVAKHHDELSDFIGRHIQVRTDGAVDQRGRAFVDKRIGDFRMKLEKDKSIAGKWIKDVKKGERPKYPWGEMDFQGLTVPTDQGKKDLLHDKVPGLHPNITIQEGVQTFVHWRSSQYLEAAAAGDSPELKKRIYLNPAIESSVGIFSEIVEAADAAGLVVKGKILDRTSDGLKSAANGIKPPDSLRGDGIVISVIEEDANRLLGVVEEIYKRHQADFIGRKVSKIPRLIGEGVAVGEDVSSKESLTSHRADALGSVVVRVRQNMGLQAGESISPDRRAEALRVFATVWSQVASETGINPNNIAFNAG